MKQALQGRVRFGAFELDPREGELLRDGQRIVLQEQQLRVLLLLIARRGEIASREEFRKRLWPNGTVVEFDHGINSSIRNLRAALGDSAEEPKYIATIGRSGYRLLVPVEWLRAEEPPADEALAGSSVPPLPPDSAPTVDCETADIPRATLGVGRLTGKIVSHYRVLEIIGGGGMGLVYRAEDLKLGRAVALKFLPEEVGEDPTARERLAREAHAVSALDHPNICTVYDFDEYEDCPFIAMQLLSGKTLRDHIANGRFRLDQPEAVEIAIQIASGLEAAHEKGIIHRDIKPANIFITDKGVAKILDFGVAKILQLSESAHPGNASRHGAPEEDDLNEHGISRAETASPQQELEDIEIELTRTGWKVGTVGYMSPEQVCGRPLDARSDIFSFGLVLFEMATGKRAFQKPTTEETMDAILNLDPLAGVQSTEHLPSGMLTILSHCMQKDPGLRFQTVTELVSELRSLSASSTVSPSARDGHPRKIPVRLLAAAAVLILGVGIAVPAFLRFAEPAVPTVSNYLQLTHDGSPKLLVGTDGLRLYLNLTTYLSPSIGELPISGGEPNRIPSPSSLMTPMALSPDGSELLVLEGRGNPAHGPMWALSVSGGSAHRLGDISGQDAAWSPDGTMLAYADGASMYVARADGTGSRKLIAMNNPEFIANPVWSPDGSHLRFDVSDSFEGAPVLWEVSVDGTNLHRLLPGWNKAPERECCGKWTADGEYFVFQARRQIWALPRQTGFPHSEPKPIQLTASPMLLFSPLPSKDGKKLFVVGRTFRGELMRFDTKSKQFSTFLRGISAEYVAFSKDGQWVAYVSYPEGTLWRSKPDGSKRQQLTYPPLRVLHPRWSPDGKEIVYSETDSAKPGRMYQISADGGTPHPILPDDPNAQADPNWSPDGKKIVFAGGSVDPRLAIRAWTIRIFDTANSQVSTVPGSEGFYSPRWSPDGRYLVALSSDTTTLGLFDFQAHQWSQLANGSFGWPNWSRDSRYVYCIGGGINAVLRIRVSDGMVERVVDMTNFSAAGRMGTSLALAPPDDSPLLLQDTGSQDVYALDWKTR